MYEWIYMVVCVCLEKRESDPQAFNRTHRPPSGTDSQLNDRPLSDWEVTSPLKLQWYEYLTFTSFHLYLIKLKY